ncbi:MAG: hypothetical protein WD534_18585 [Phycisphaeraceae bacterium]
MSIDRFAGSMLIVSAVTVSLICLISLAMRSASPAAGWLVTCEAMNRWIAVSMPWASVATMPLSLPSTHASICSARSVEGTRQIVWP